MIYKSESISVGIVLSSSKLLIATSNATVISNSDSNFPLIEFFSRVNQLTYPSAKANWIRKKFDILG